MGLNRLDGSGIWLGRKGADWVVSVSVSQLCEALQLGDGYNFPDIHIMQESDEDMVKLKIFALVCYFCLYFFLSNAVAEKSLKMYVYHNLVIWCSTIVLL